MGALGKKAQAMEDYMSAAPVIRKPDENKELCSGAFRWCSSSLARTRNTPACSIGRSRQDLRPVSTFTVCRKRPFTYWRANASGGSAKRRFARRRALTCSSTGRASQHHQRQREISARADDRLSARARALLRRACQTGRAGGWPPIREQSAHCVPVSTPINSRL